MSSLKKTSIGEISITPPDFDTVVYSIAVDKWFSDCLEAHRLIMNDTDPYNKNILLQHLIENEKADDRAHNVEENSDNVFYQIRIQQKLTLFNNRKLDAEKIVNSFANSQNTHKMSGARIAYDNATYCTQSTQTEDEDKCNVFEKPYDTNTGIIYKGAIIEPTLAEEIKKYIIMFTTLKLCLMDDPYRCHPDCNYRKNQSIYKYPTSDQLVNMTKTRCSRNFLKGAISSIYVTYIKTKQLLQPPKTSMFSFSKELSITDIMKMDENYELDKRVSENLGFMPPRQRIAGSIYNIIQNLVYGIINVDNDKINLIKNYKRYPNFLINKQYNRYGFCTFDPNDGSYIQLNDDDIQEIKNWVDATGDITNDTFINDQTNINNLGLTGGKKNKTSRKRQNKKSHKTKSHKTKSHKNNTKHKMTNRHK